MRRDVLRRRNNWGVCPSKVSLNEGTDSAGLRTRLGGICEMAESQGALRFQWDRGPMRCLASCQGWHLAISGRNY